VNSIVVHLVYFVNLVKLAYSVVLDPRRDCLLRRFNQLDVPLQQLVHELAHCDTLGRNALAEIPVDGRLQL